MVPIVRVPETVSDFQVGTRLRIAIEEWPIKTRAVLHDGFPQVSLLFQRLEIFVDQVAGFFAVDAVAPAFWEVDFGLRLFEIVLEFWIAPSAAPIKLEPILDLGFGGLGIVRKDSGVSYRIAGTVEGMIAVPAFGIDRFTVEHSRRPLCIAGCNSGRFAHMAILACDAGGGSRRRAILVPDDLQLDLRIHGHLVARDAELRLGKLIHLG